MAGVITENNMADAYNLAQAGTLTPEQFAQQQQLNRQQQMASMLMQQSAQPQGQMISGRYVAPSWAQQLVPLANIMASKYIGEKADTKAAELAQQLRTGKTAAEESIVNKLTGAPAQATELAGPYTGKVPMPVAVQPEVKPDLAAALREIRTNQYGVGKEYVPAILKQMMPEAPSSVLEYQYAQKNPEFAGYQMGLKKAGAPNVTTVMGKSIASEVGPMMKEAQGIAQAAVKTEDSANRILQAVDSNKLFTGTGANVRLGAAQLANTLNLGGDTLEAKIGNTRQAMQGLAELTLQGRQQMRGQGAITESESKLAEKAISGDISFTPTEIRQLANAAKRSSEYAYGAYQTKLGEMAKNPDTSGLVPYHQVPRMTPQNAMPDQSAIDAEIARRQGRR